MKKTFAYLSATLLLLAVLSMPGPVILNALPGYGALQDDSVRVEELLLLDTVDLKIHGPSRDVRFYMNGIIFLSNTKYHQEMIPDHITFGVVKAYFVPLEYVSLESSRPLFPNDDFPYSPGGMSFTRDYRKVYFTQEVAVNGRRRAEKIFEMSIINGQASVHNQLSFTGDPSRYMDPAISMDDSFMIFASDRTPSNGGLDLFITRRTEDGWSTPKNMGSSINTSGHEWYPYLDHQNNLYFSSSGHMGYGGYDVYVCLFDGSGWEEPRNMTNYINTGADELAFSLSPNKKMAVFTRVEGTESKGDVMAIELNNKALVLSGIENPENQDMAGLLKDMIKTGYTSGSLATTTAAEQKGFNLTALPLISEQEKQNVEQEPLPEQAEPEEQTTMAEPLISDEMLQPEQEPEQEPVSEQPVEEQQQVREEPVIEMAVTQEPQVEEPEPEPEPVEEPAEQPDPNRIIFRVQIISNTGPNANPTVTIEGTRYSTWEYFYKGAYRVTVGEFETVSEASTFRIKCRNSGYSQAFVAAFRGNERETDPSVFRQ